MTPAPAPEDILRIEEEWRGQPPDWQMDLALALASISSLLREARPVGMSPVGGPRKEE